MNGLWFNDKTARRMSIRSATSLVGKKPTKSKRIKAMCTMYLDGGGEDQISGLPDWLCEARDFVMKSGEQVTASHVIKEVNAGMRDANLFQKKTVEAPRSQLDHFVIKQVGKADEKDTILTFEMRCAFSTDLWMWVGQQSGEEFDVVFEVIGQEVGETEFLENEDASDDPDTPQDDEDEEDATEDEDEETPIEDVEDDEVALKRHTKNLLAM
jgi:hypothetical protein